MNLNEQLTVAMLRCLAETRRFTFMPSHANPHTVDFEADGKVNGPPEREFDSWALSYMDTRKCHELRLYKDGGLSCVMHLTGQGLWKGRSVRTGATSVLRPHDAFISKWVLYSNPAKFARTLIVDDREPTFYYREALPRQIDWTPYAFDIREKVRVEALPDSQTAIALVACDRPAYFKQVLHTCAQNPEFMQLPVFGFFDMPEDHRREWQRDEQIQALLEVNPNAVIVKRPRNFGCGRNIIDARRQLFDHLQYRRVFVFEDDMKIAPNYIGFVTNMFNWAQSTYTNIGAVQGWVRCDAPLGSARTPALNLLKATYSNWWGYCLCKEAWDSMKDDVYTYEKLFLGGEYKYRPHLSIKSWFRMKLERSLAPVGARPYSLPHAVQLERSNYFQEPPTGQDAVTMHTFETHGWIRLCPVVNRGEYIGKQGIHMTTRLWVRDGYDKLVHEIYPDDASRKTFEVVGSWSPPKLEGALPGITFMEKV